MVKNALINVYTIQGICFKNTNGSIEIIKALINIRFDPDAMNDRAQTVVSLTLQNKSSKMLEILTTILEKANVNKKLIIYEKNEKKKKDKRGYII